jgi:hypothetical protein
MQKDRDRSPSGIRDTQREGGVVASSSKREDQGTVLTGIMPTIGVMSN